MPKAVFDTVVFVRSLLHPYGPAGKLVFSRTDAYTLVLSPPIIREALEVLRRPEITRKFRSVAGMDLGQVLDLLARGEIVELDEVPPISPDPKDDIFLATVRLGNADYLVSEDRDLLDLVSYEQTRIVNVPAFLDILAQLNRN